MIHSSNEASAPKNAVRSPNYNSASDLRVFLQEHGLAVRKQWGQNFLINGQARAAIVDSLGVNDGAAVWEIGSGPGSMTSALLAKGCTVTAFEIDPGFCSILERLFSAASTFTLIKGDVLKTWKSAPRAPYLLGNLPYNVAAMLIGNLISGGCVFERMVITVQKEVAERMSAHCGSKEYSSISVLCASAYTARRIMTLKGQSFYPAPKVDSAVVCFDRLTDRQEPPPIFYPMLRALFSARRKTIANNLQNFLASCGILQERRSDIAAAALGACGLSGKERAETLLPDTFFALATELERMIAQAQRNE